MLCLGIQSDKTRIVLSRITIKRTRAVVHVHDS